MNPLEKAQSGTGEADRTVTSAILMLTSACNLRCDYCFEADHTPGYMDTDTMLQGIRWLLSVCGDYAGIVLFGGEPMLCSDSIPWLVSVARDEARKAGKRVTFSTTTNGTLVDEKVGAMLKEAGVRIQLSADGTAAGHDVHRKLPNQKGSFYLVEKAIPHILDAYPSATVRMSITPQNVHDMANGIRYFYDCGFNSVSPVPVEEADWTEESLDLFAENLEEAAAVFIRHLLSGRMIRLYNISDTIQRTMSRQNKYPCGAGRTAVAIDVDGSIYPCQRFIGYTSSDPQWRLGDVRAGIDEAKRDIFYETTTDRIKEHCADCMESGNMETADCGIRSLCNGGCIAVNYFTLGSMDKPYPKHRIFRSMAVNTTHNVIRYLEANYRDVWDRYISALANRRTQSCQCQKLDIEK